MTPFDRVVCDYPLPDLRIPGAEKLVLMLLATRGLRRVAALVGRAAWLAAAERLD